MTILYNFHLSRQCPLLKMLIIFLNTPQKLLKLSITFFAPSLYAMI